MDLLETIKDVLKIADQLRDVELKRKLTNVQIECVELAQENAMLREKMLQLEEIATNTRALVFHDNGYWAHRDGDLEEGPFCPKCWVGEGKAVPMTAQTHWLCVVCNTDIIRPPPVMDQDFIPPRESSGERAG